MGDAIAVALLKCKKFSNKDFARFHPGGSLGKRLHLTLFDLSLEITMPAVKSDAKISEVILTISKNRVGATAVLDNDDAIEGLWKSQYPLNEFTGESNFKSYDELKTRLDTVLSGKTTVGNVTDSIEEETVAVPKVDTTPSEAPKVADSVDSEDQDSMDYFNKLANA